MSMSGRPASTPADSGDVVATFATYEAAQKAVSSLIAAEVPAREISIVGRGLRSVERVTGRLGWATAARTGAINGILLGLVFSLFFVLGQPDVPIQLFIGVMLVGVALGMLTQIAVYSIIRRRRDYASVMQVIAESYEVTVSSGSAGRARQVLGPRASAAPVRPVPAAVPADVDPPQYGERLPDPGVATPDGDPSAPASVEGVDEPQSPDPEVSGPGEPAPGPGDPSPVPPGSDEIPPGPGERSPLPPPGVAGAA